MSFTPSKMLPLGTTAPKFKLLDTLTDKILDAEDLFANKATLVMFLCNHCPYVIHVNPELVRLVQDYKKQGVGFIGISSNDADKYPEDGPKLMREHAQKEGYDFPYLYDETQEVARSYDAACTPDFFLFDGKNSLVYRGRLDDSRPGNDKPLTGKDLRAALDAVLAQHPISTVQYPSGGCNIKWKE
jgi:peroxiredoxin